MPEGNEIHRWAERHAAAFAGKPVRMDGPQGRFTGSDVLDGRKLLRVMAVGKHLGYDFGKDRILHIHLGLQGDFTEGSGPLPPVRGALRLRMWSAAKVKLPAAPGESKRILELNPGHVIVKNLAALARRDAGSPKLAEWSELLLDQALLAEGVVNDPASLVRRIQALLAEASEAAIKGAAS